MSDRKNQDCVLHVLQAVEGQVTATSARDDQLPQSILYGPADQRMPDQYTDGFLNQLKRLGCHRIISLDQEVAQSFEIGKRSSRIAQLCQDLAFGFGDLLPEIRAFRYA